MNELLIPPCPNWFDPHILACTPDKTLVYGARSDLVFIKDTPDGTPADVKIIPRAHLYRVFSVCANRNYGQANKLVVSTGEDKLVKLWDCDTLEKKSSHNAHVTHEKVVGAVFAGDDRVISVTENGTVVIWNIVNNQTTVLRDIFTIKVHITSLSSCPHATWLAAFGLRSGLVVVADLRKNGRTLYKLRGHEKPVVSLAWCPAPVNIFPKNPNNFVGIKKTIENSNKEKDIDNSTVVQSPEKRIIPGSTDVESKPIELGCKKEHIIEKREIVTENQLYDPHISSSNQGITKEETDVKDLQNEANYVSLSTNHSVKVETVVTEGEGTSSTNLGSEMSFSPTKQELIKEEIDAENTGNGPNKVFSPEQKVLKAQDNVLLSNQEIIKKETSIEDAENKEDEMTPSPEKEVLEKEIVTTMGNESNPISSSKQETENVSFSCKQETVNIQTDIEDPGVACIVLPSREGEHMFLVQDSVPDKFTFSEQSECARKTGPVKTPKSKGNLWTNLTFPEDAEGPKQNKGQEDHSQPESDFLKECQMLKDMLQVVSKQDNPVVKVENVNEEFCRPKLIPRRNIGNKSQEKEKQAFGTSDGPEVLDEVAKSIGTIEVSQVEGFFNGENMKKIETSTPMVPRVSDEDEGIEDDLNMPMLETEKVSITRDNDTGIEVENNFELEGSPHSLSIKPMNVVEENKNRTIVGNWDMSLTCHEVGRTICVSEEEEPRKEFLLASSARENNIYIWRAGTDGRLQTLLTLPNKSNKKSRKSGPPEKPWIALCWAAPKVLLSSSKNAELMQWTLPKPKDSSKDIRLIHNDHRMLLLNIASPVKYLTDENWNEERGSLNAWTLGQDRLLLNTDLGKEKKLLGCYPTLGGGVTTLATSSVDPNRLAFGTTDGNINIFDLSRPHTKCIFTTTIYQKIQSKVTALAWHPNQELLLAYGTTEGRVGYVDTSSKGKSPILFPHFFKSDIFSIEWGPLNGDVSNLGVYAVSENKLVAFSLNNSDEGIKEVDFPDNTSAYTFSWKPDFSLLLISTKAGILLKYDKKLNLMGSLYMQQKFQPITWHPDASISDTNISKYCNWFVTVIRSGGFRVYEMIDDSEKIVFKVDDKRKITTVAWSPHDGNKLVVGFEDGFANVYDVEAESVLATYMSPYFENVLSLLWSPADPNLIITGLIGNKLQIWNINNNPAVSNEEIITKRRKLLKSATKEAPDLVPNLELPDENEVTKTKAKDTSKTLLPVFYSIKDSQQVAKDTKKLLDWKKGVENIEVNAGDNKYIDVLQIFGDSSEMVNIINMNESYLKQRGKYNFSTKAALFKGDVATSVKEAIAAKRVDPFIISLCPMISPKLWQLACETYAQQLIERADSDPLETATYLLALHKVEDAINILCEGSMFKEALALAKSRLQGDDVISTVVEKWAKHLQFTGYFEMAANCYICLEKYEEAAMVLFRRSDVEVLRLAVEVAELSRNEELIKAVTLRYNAFKEEADSKEAGTKTGKDGEAQVHKIQHKNKKKHLKKTTDENKIDSEHQEERKVESELELSKQESENEEITAAVKLPDQETNLDNLKIDTRDIESMTEYFNETDDGLLENKGADPEPFPNQESNLNDLEDSNETDNGIVENKGADSETFPSLITEDSKETSNGIMENQGADPEPFKQEHKYIKEPEILHEFLERYKPKKEVIENGAGALEDSLSIGTKMKLLESNDNCDLKVPVGIKSPKNSAEKVNIAVVCDTPADNNDSSDISLD